MYFIFIFQVFRCSVLRVGVDLICAQGGEGGGHTGDVATSILIPKVVDLCKGATSPLTGGACLRHATYAHTHAAPQLCSGLDRALLGLIWRRARVAWTVCTPTVQTPARPLTCPCRRCTVQVRCTLWRVRASYEPLG